MENSSKNYPEQSESCILSKNDAEPPESLCSSESFENRPTESLLGTCVELPDTSERFAGPSSPGPSVSSPGPSVSSPGPSYMKPGPSSDASILSCADSDTFNTDSEPSSTDSELANFDPEPSGAKSGPPTSNPGPIHIQTAVSQAGRNKTRHRRSLNRLVCSKTSVSVSSRCTPSGSIIPSEAGTSSTSSPANDSQTHEVVLISLPTVRLCAENADIVNDYNGDIGGIVHKFCKYRRAANDTKGFVLECRLRFLQVIDARRLMELQKPFSNCICKLEQDSAELARITNQAEPYLDSCLKTAALLNGMEDSFSRPPLSPEFIHALIKTRDYLPKLDASISTLAGLIRQAKFKYKIYNDSRRLAVKHCSRS